LAARSSRSSWWRRGTASEATSATGDLASSAAKPIEIDSPARVEPRVQAMQCPACGGSLALRHQAVASDERGLLREITTQCRACGAERRVWFRVVGPAVH
jgi:RNase P subunit RPR2